MSTAKLINELHKQGIQLWVEGSRLRFRAPQGAMTPTLRAQLQAAKSELIEFLREAQGAQHFSIQPAKREGKLPLSSGQQRLWVLEQIETQYTPYNDVAALQLDGPLQVTVLQGALIEIVRRHEVLRTTFASDETGTPFQYIHDPQLDWSVVDLTTTSVADQPATIERVARTEAQRRFDLTSGPLFRVRLLQLAPQSHVLLVIVHHLVGDGWSIGVILQELSILYTAALSTDQRHGAVTPVVASLPELPIQYADYAIWQQEQLADEAMMRHLDYWRAQMAGAPVLLQLPTDRPRPAQQSFQGGRLPVQIDAALTRQLQQLARKLGATPFMLLLSAFNVLLARYSRQDDIVVGAPIANRQQAVLEPLVGFFVNTLLLRANLSANPSFTTLVNQVKQVTHDAYEHQDLPFEKLVEALQPERNLSYTPLFQVMFAYQNLPAIHTVTIADLQLQPLDIDLDISKFDLRLELFERDTGLTGAIEYNRDIFEATTVVQMMAHFQTLLRAIVADPDQPIATLPLLTAAERHQILGSWNDTAVAHPQPFCLHQRFEEQVVRAPDAVAVLLVGGMTKQQDGKMGGAIDASTTSVQLTYRELNARANQLAHHLQQLGIGPETMVGICAERSVEMVVGLLGILKAGGAYVPLDPTYPQERLAFLIEDAQVPILLTQTHLQPTLPQPALPQSDDAHHTQIICLDGDWATIASQPTHNPSANVSGDNLAYMIYTSGSTGKPKGAMIPHRAIVNRLCWMQDKYQLRAADHVLQKTPFSFDVSVWEFFWPLSTGARLVMAHPGGHTDPVYLARTIQQQAITVMHFVPPMLQLFLEAEGVEQCTTLRTVICSGEELPVELVKRFYAKLPQHTAQRSVALHNLYGPTEAAVDVSYWACQPTTDLTTVPIGYPVANTQLYILDPQGEPVPTGVAGELHIGGIQVGRGYHNRPELTKAKFIANPFGPGTHYKTGDLARYRRDGAIEFLGRIDNQIKLRGFRIELGEIEAVLAEHPAVQEAILCAREDHPGSKRLVAYLTLANAQRRSTVPLDLAELRAFLQQKLPEHMVPAAFVLLDMLPLTPNGKVDRRALPAPAAADLAVGTEYAPPRTVIEERLVALWRELLRVERVGIHDNFFALGGDSILSIQLIARAKQAKIELTPKQIFQHQTIAKLAGVAGTVRVVNAEQGVVTGIVPLTPIQQWYLAQEQPEPHHFNQSLLVTVAPQVNPSWLASAVEALWHHHDGLRLQFMQVDGQWQQVNAGIESTAETAFLFCPRFDLHALDAEAQAATLQAQAAKLQASLNLTTGPLMRAAYFDYGPTQAGRLLIVIHHLAVDGVSWRILLEDLALAYQQAQQGQPLQLPPKTTSFQTWARWLAEEGPQVVADERTYWQQVCQQPHAPLPIDHPVDMAANTVDSVDEVICSLSTAETAALLRDVPSVYHTEINDLLLTALVQSIGQWSNNGSNGSNDAVYLNLEGHGREVLAGGEIGECDRKDGDAQELAFDLSRTVGWFTSLFPVYLSLPSGYVDEQPGKAIQSVKEQLRQIPRRGAGYGILRYLGQDQTLIPAVEPALSFNYLGQLDATLPESNASDAPSHVVLGMANEAAGEPHSPRQHRPHLLDINGMVLDGALQLSWRYSRNVHAHSTIEALAQSYIAALRVLIAHCRTPEAGGFTPSDCPTTGVDQAQLDQLLARLSTEAGIPPQQIEQIYALSPMQEGILYETLYAPQSGVYSTQICLTVGEQLDVAAFRQAWQQIVDRHAVLRTAFIWDVDKPLQVVTKARTLPWETLDWWDEPELETRLDAFLLADRQRGFSLEQAPLARATLIRANATTSYFVWTHHHILMDGWSVPIMFQELISLYNAAVQQKTLYLDPPRPYQDYIRWRQQQDLAAAERYWRTTLQGVAIPPSLPFAAAPDAQSLPKSPATVKEMQQAEDRIVLPPKVVSALTAFAKTHHLTPSTLLQGAWALLLYHDSGREDLLFGTAVAGRPATLAAVDTMVGLFINTVPLRITLLPGAPLIAWLQSLQRQQIEREAYTVAPLVDIHSWSELPPGIPFFDHLFIYENYPFDPTLQHQTTDFIRDVRSSDQTNYPLTVIVEPHAEFTVRFLYDRSRFDAASIARAAARLQTILVEMTADADQLLNDLPSIRATDWQAQKAAVTTDGSSVEIMRILLAHPSVADCHIVHRATADGTASVIAYVVSHRTGADFSATELREHLQAHAPGQVHPNDYVPVKNLPLYAGGTVDEEALTALAVLDEPLLREWETTIRVEPAVAEVAVVVQSAATPAQPYHLTELFPAVLTPDTVTVDTGVAEASTVRGPDFAKISSTGVNAPHDGLVPAFSDGGPLLIPDDAPKTLGAALLATAARFPDKGITYVTEDESVTFQSYAALVEEAKQILTGLSAAGLTAGDRVILQVASLRDYVPTLWGCILGGITPVTVAIATAYAPHNAVVNKLFNTWQLLAQPPILASSHLQTTLTDLGQALPMPALTVIPVEPLRDHPPAQQLHPSQPDDVVFLQLTSGSTGIPKCIQETHRGIIAHIHGSQQQNGYTNANISLNWLPMDHVVPLLTCHFKDTYLGCEQVEVATNLVLANPLKWLDLIERYRVTHTWSPNFGFKLVADALAMQPQQTWDLSSLALMMNAGEQVTEPAVRDFLTRVTPFQISPQVIQPAFGMAEVCTCMTYQNHFGKGNDVHHIRKSSLGGRLQALSQHQSFAVDTIDFVDLGPPMPGVQIRIVDAQNQLLPEGVIGRFQIKGDVVTPGYLYNEAANQEAFVGDGWFNSGDLGFIIDGRLTLTGREKEMIIVNGANFYCYEIEEIVNSVAGVMSTFSAACGIPDPVTGTEGIAIFFVPQMDPAEMDQTEDLLVEQSIALIPSIRSAVIQALGIAPVHVIPMAKAAFPKTTSGKIQRTKLKILLLDGRFQPLLQQIDIKLENANTLPDWFYTQRWRVKTLPARRQQPQSGNRLLFLDQLGLGRALRADVESTAKDITVEIGYEFAQISPNHYRLDPAVPMHYQQLFAALADAQILLDQIVHLWSYDHANGDVDTLSQLQAAQQRGIYSMLYLLQALIATQGANHAVALWVISSHAQATAPGEQIAYAKSTLMGLMKTISQEFPWLDGRHIDLAIEDETLGVEAYVKAHARVLRHEFRLVTGDAEVAYRRQQRMVPTLAKVDLRTEQRAKNPIQSGGLYLVTGGLGGIGTAICRRLLQTYGVKLLIIGRTPLPIDGQEAAENPSGSHVAQRLANYQLLQATGGTVRYVAVDVCDQAALQAAVAEAEATWNSSLAGVLHLAGEGNLGAHWAEADQRRLAVETGATFEQVFHAKVYGTWTLHQLLKTRPHAALIAFSSVNSLFGGTSFGAYAAANSFVDGYCHYRRATIQPEEAQTKHSTYSFNWSQWDDLGMSHNNPSYAREAAREQGFRVISQEQGIHSFLAGLLCNQRQLIVGLDGNSPNVQRYVQHNPSAAQALAAYCTLRADGSAQSPHATVLTQLTTRPLTDRFGTNLSCQWHLLPELPRDARGEIDRAALAQTTRAIPQPKGERSLPRTEVEIMLAEICQEVLGIARVSIHDNFFELGGDSILMIQVIARARQVGLHITPQAVVQNPTIAQLADVVDTAQTVDAEQGLVTGPLPLMPIQQWYLSQEPTEPHHFNQYVLLQVTPQADPTHLEAALHTLLRHHDALRLRFTQEDGHWAQVNGGVDGLNRRDAALLQHVDLAADNNATQRTRLTQVAAEMQASLQLAEGRLMRAALFWYGPNQPAHLLIVIHHLAVDGVSWRILLEDLELAYQQARQNMPSQLPAKTTSFQAWATWLANHGTTAVEAERTYWQQIIDQPQPTLPLDDQAGMTQNTVASVAEVTVVLTREETADLLRNVPAIYHTEINDILLTALLQTLCQWTGGEAITIDLEGHGRELLRADDQGRETPSASIDLSRTVGWFTSLFPIHLVWTHRELGEMIKSVKEQIRRMPNHGVGYGILRYLDKDNPLRPHREPEVSFNYLGQFDTALHRGDDAPRGGDRLLLDFAHDAVGAPISPLQQRPRLLDISGIVVDGQMQFVWAYSRHLHQHATIATLADNYIAALRTIIAHCLANETGGFTPSDFPEADLNQLELDELLAEFG